ncbi:hypothetical protein AWC05_16625 [Mycobacterium florentinum]|uniref:Uncharacterized protein n=1 Tax=Mycobacterium florentinum TaxID=292462 RepID=A0A1X1UBT6_MYCFL|nr:hypothetical protein [Mycobacterium florentinum]MCV7412240.1 hypothetical protein [Mycobacterium florentinum]ORV54246.1 hypothetical protein AWC05_16625 [Mycobacterium florentinum]BBX81619.1 hypothetical protein MFLOJ_54060 [Mycobacterium florentinum]
MATDEHPADQELPASLVAWAGLPIDLDFAFSQVQRDKVYVQHLARERWRSLRARGHDYDAEYDPLNAEAG